MAGPGEFNIRMMEFVFEMMIFVFKMMSFVGADPARALRSDGRGGQVRAQAIPTTM